MKSITFFVYLLIKFIFLNSASIELYSDKDYMGFIPYGTFFSGWRESPTSCFTFPPVAQRKLSSFKANGHCVIFYDNESCTGNSFKLDKDVSNIADLWKNGTQDNYDDKAVSLQPCSEEDGGEGGRKVNVDFFKEPFYEGNKLPYRDVCVCQNFPLDQLNISSVDNHHHCVILFPAEDCQGEGKYIYGGKGSVSESIARVEFPFSTQARSFTPCEPPQHCMKLTAEIYRYEVYERESNDDLKYSSISMGAHTYFFNNGSATVLQEYSPNMKVNEERVIGKIEFNNRISSWNVVSKTKLEFQLEIKLGSSTIGGTLPIDFEDAYGNTCEDGVLSQDTVHYSRSSVDYSVTQTIVLPPCRAYDVNATLNVVENYQMDYKAYFQLKGELNGRTMTAEELKTQADSMPGYNYDHIVDDSTVAVWAQSYITASFGVETMIRGEGSRIQYCYY